MSPVRAVSLLLVGGLVIRLVALWLVAPTPPIADEIEYEFRSKAMVEGTEVLGEPGSRPPVVIWYYALWQRLFGVGTTIARLGNVFASVLTIWLVYLLAARFADKRTALVAAAVTAAYPNLVFFSVSTWTETLYVALTTGGLVLLLSRRESAVPVAIAGLVFGGAALTREVGLVLLPLGVFWIAWGVGPARTWSRVAAFVIGFALPIIPWTVHINRGDEAGFVLIAHTSYMNLYLGNNPDIDPDRPGRVFSRIRDYRKLGKTAREREARAKEIALEEIRGRMPLWPFEKIVTEFPKLMSPSSFPTARLMAMPAEPQGRRKVGPGRAYVLSSDGSALGWIRGPLAAATVIGWIAVAIVGTGGLVFAWEKPVTRLLLLFTLLHVIPPLIAFGSTRFRLPFVPILILGAAAVLAGGGAALASASRRRRRVAVAISAIVAIVIASRWSALAGGWG